MDELKQKAIRHHYAKLIDSLNPLRVMDHLANLLSLEEIELIRKSQFTPQERTRELIVILCRKNEELGPFDCFIKALEETDNNHEMMAKAILKTYGIDNGTIDVNKVSRISFHDTGETKYDMKIAQQVMKEMYRTRFQKVYPFSLPFTFDIENTWVSLALKEENKDSEETEDHAKLLEQAFKKGKMLIIEGDPATGKTSLMRRLAYEWAKGKQELLHYDLLLYAEFREVREKTFKSIADLVLCYTKNYLTDEDYENIKKILTNAKNCKECCILVLLDGYDESSLEKQCSELSSYINEKMIHKALFFNTVVTARKGPLSMYRDSRGRLAFAEVLGFSTRMQKDNYISKHFFSNDTNYKEKIEAVHSLLAKNENMNKLAETPLFLTFICLVYEKIVDGTLLELYYNIVRWLIDRHQQDNPDRDVPALFQFQCESEQTTVPLNIRQKQNIIRNNYLQFPQLLCLGKMALKNLKKDIFRENDFTEFGIKSIIHEVGLIRKDEFYDQAWNPTTQFCFPHRTIQEFLAALYCFVSNDDSDEWVDIKEYVHIITEYENFLLRLALSEKIPLRNENREMYFKEKSYLAVDLDFDVLNSTDALNVKLLNELFLQFLSVKKIGIHNGVYIPPLTFKKLSKCTNVSFHHCTFEGQSLISFIDCSSLTTLELLFCDILVTTKISFAKLPIIAQLRVFRCKVNLIAWQSITKEIASSSVTCLQLICKEALNTDFLKELQKCELIEELEIGGDPDELAIPEIVQLRDMKNVRILKLSNCTFKASCQISYINCPSLKALTFSNCKIECNTVLGLTSSCLIDSLEFYDCEIDIRSWQSIVEEIRNSFVRHLAIYFRDEINSEIVNQLRNCNCIIETNINGGLIFSRFSKLEVLHINKMINVHTLSFSRCIFEANSQINFMDCSSMKSLTFKNCEFRSIITLGLTKLPEVDTLEFHDCKFDSRAWNSIIDEIKRSSIRRLAVQFKGEISFEFIKQLQKCKCIKEISITEDHDKWLLIPKILEFSDLADVYSLEFSHCIFDSYCLISFINCSSLEILTFSNCKFKCISLLGLAHLRSIDTFEFNNCKIDIKSWQSIVEEIGNSSVKVLRLNFNEVQHFELLNALQNRKRLKSLSIGYRDGKMLLPEQLSLNDVINVHTLSFSSCIIKASSQIPFLSFSLLKALKFYDCEFRSITVLGLTKLPEINKLVFNKCKLDWKAWHSITQEIKSSTIKHLVIKFHEVEDFGILKFLHDCRFIERLKIGYGFHKWLAPELIRFKDMLKVRALTFSRCIFEANLSIILINCLSVKTLRFVNCEFRRIGTFAFKKLPVICELELNDCKFDLKAWHSIIDEMNSCSVKRLVLKFSEERSFEILNHLQECNFIENIELQYAFYKVFTPEHISQSGLRNIHTLTFLNSIFDTNSQILFLNFPSLKILKFTACEFRSITTIDFTMLPIIDELELYKCKFDLKAWHSIINEISRCSIRRLVVKFSKERNFEILDHLKECKLIKNIELQYDSYYVLVSEQISLNGGMNIHTLAILNSNFESDSRISFINCPSVKILRFIDCDFEPIANIDFVNLLVVDTLEFIECKIDLKAWQIITEEMRKSTIQCLKLSPDFFLEEETPEFLNVLQKCECIEKIVIVGFYICVEEQTLAINLSQLAREMKRLKRIVFESKGRLKDINKILIEKAGRANNDSFLVSYSD